jgi:phenylacetate-CoA ligase
MLVGALWGSPPVAKTVKEKIRNQLHDRVFYLDTMRLDDESMLQFVSEMQKRRPEMLFGHAHSLFIFASFLRDRQLVVPPIRGIIATSMMLIDSERKVIEAVFGCAVTNRYGCEEVGLIGSECEVHRGMHLNAEHVFVEFVRDDGSWAGPGEEGRIVVTDLMNHGMPLVRYAVGDLGVPSDRACSCGRGLPIMDRLTGRTADFLKRRDGSQVAGISLVEKTLTAIIGIGQLQIIQEALDSFVLNIVPAADFSSSTEQELRQVILKEFGDDVQIATHRVDRLAQDRNSKYRFSICKV